MGKRSKSGGRILKLLTEVATRARVRIPPEVADDTLRITPALLAHTLEGLRTRSAGYRESGAIWTGHVSGTTSFVQDVHFYHDLCDDKGHALSLELSEEAKYKLYQQLADREQVLVGMIHTHPESWVDLSWVDRENQLCSRIGFWSLVLPYYGKRKWCIGTTGVHIRTDSGWHWFNKAEASKRIINE
jgi:proteasome lid subunit RPN8/RPN11